MTLTVNYCPGCGTNARHKKRGINLCAGDSVKCECGITFILGPTPCYRSHVSKSLRTTLRNWWNLHNEGVR
jgi:hypothetical protein